MFLFLAARIFVFLVARKFVFLVARKFVFLVARKFLFLVARKILFPVARKFLFLVARKFFFLVARKFLFPFALSFLLKYDIYWAIHKNQNTRKHKCSCNSCGTHWQIYWYNLLDRIFTIMPTSNYDQTFAGKDGIKILMTVISSLSMFGSITIIATYYLFQNMRTTSRKILVCISIGDFFTVFPSLVLAWVRNGPHNYSHYHYFSNCVVQSFVSSTAVMWSFMWTSSLAIYLYFVVVKKRLELAERLMVFFHVINWCVPLILIGIAWVLQKLGSLDAETSGGWCWITEKEGEKWKAILWMLACGKLCEIASYFVNGILCSRIYRKIKEEVRDKIGGW